jgi:hypothetical protein
MIYFARKQDCHACPLKPRCCSVAKSIETGTKLKSPLCDATFRDDCLGKFADLDGIAAKHRNFEASSISR